MTDEGWLAEFSDADSFEKAVCELSDDGYRSMEVFTPYPVPGVLSLLGGRASSVTRIAGAAAIVGVVSAYVLQWYLNAYDYPLDVGGRPPHSIPAFIPITFEMGVLFASVAAVVAALVLSKLPRLWRPVFEVEGFERATIDRFFVLVRSDDPEFDWALTRARLVRLKANRVSCSGRKHQ